MPLRAFIDSDKILVRPSALYLEYIVLMPLRAFIDSDDWFWTSKKMFLENVLMPLRAFIDSDVIATDYTKNWTFSLNALTGIYWFWLKPGNHHAAYL